MSSADDKKTTWFRLFRADCANANKTYTEMYIHKTERQKNKSSMHSEAGFGATWWLKV